MRYQEHRPPPALARYVTCLWSLTGTAHQPAYDLVLPDGRPELVVHRGDRFRRQLASGVTRVQARRLIVGQMAGAVAIAPGRRIETVGVRFTPAGLGPLCPFPQAELADRIMAAARVPSPALRRVSAAALQADTLDDAVAALVNGLTHAYEGAPVPDPRVIDAVRRITASGGTLTLPALTHQVGASARWLERRFQSAVGIGPKRLARLVRFRRAVAALEANPRGGGADVALDHGYYDQAHFIAEFRTIAGDAPRRFVARRLAELTRCFVDRSGRP
jgi:AraC-like DNA-binding protein